MSRPRLIFAIAAAAVVLLPTVAWSRAPRDIQTSQTSQANPIGVNRVGSAAVAAARLRVQPRSGGFFRYGWRVTKGSVLSGGICAGAGYFVGGPTLAMSWGTKGAGAGCAVSSMSGGGTGVFKRSDRCFARAVLAEADGQCVRKHYYKLKGIVWSGVESGATNAVTMGGFGALFTGPTGVLPAAATGAVYGAAFGVAVGTTRAYVVPFFQRRSLGWSMGRASRALSKLERIPTTRAGRRRPCGSWTGSGPSRRTSRCSVEARPVATAS